MKSKPESAEYKTFSEALGKVLSVSHSELQAKLQAEKMKKPTSKRASSLGRVSGGKG